jgi:hypothetical protein
MADAVLNAVIPDMIRNPVFKTFFWIPACAGMTNYVDEQSNSGIISASTHWKLVRSMILLQRPKERRD